MTETAKRILTDAGYNNLVWGAMIIEAELLGFFSIDNDKLATSKNVEVVN